MLICQTTIVNKLNIIPICHCALHVSMLMSAFKQSAAVLDYRILADIKAVVAMTS